jgi:hypothetical protein
MGHVGRGRARLPRADLGASATTGSVPGSVEYAAVDSGFAMPGSYVVVDIEPADGGGSTLHVSWDRRGKNLFGKLFVGLMVPTRVVAIRRSFKNGPRTDCSRPGAGNDEGGVHPAALPVDTRWPT